MPGPADRFGDTPDSSGVLHADDRLPALHRAQDAYAALLLDCDPTMTVLACAPWTVTDLTLHLANIHRWAAEMAAGGSDWDDDTVGPRDPAWLHEYYLSSAAMLRADLHRLGPDHPAETLNGPGPASFWHRRQLHETLVHLADLAQAADRPHPIDDPTVWADAVDEVVTVLMPRQIRLHRIDPPEDPVVLRSTDTGLDWRLGPRSVAPAATVTGTAQQLALMLWHRIDPAELSIDADDLPSAHRTLGRALTP